MTAGQCGWCASGRDLCGFPATRFYLWSGTLFCRCEEHKYPAGPTMPDEEVRELTEDEVAAYEVHQT